MANNSYFDKDGRYSIKPVTLETVDRAVKDYFDKNLNVTVDTETTRKKVNTIFATGERWKLTRDNLRDENRNIDSSGHFYQKRSNQQRSWPKSNGTGSALHHN